MNERDNNSYIHPTVLRVLRIVGLALVLLTVYLCAKMAITFCLGLFADGEHVVQLPWQESPVVMREDTGVEQAAYIDPSLLAEVARIDLAVTGDVMPHLPIVRTSQTSDGYDFSPVFRYITPYLSAADLAVANLETTLSGTDEKEFTGYPNFNSPDAMALSAKNAGLDLLLTGNEHCYDYGTAGLQRTLTVLQSHGVAALGTAPDREQSRHSIQSVGGVNIGMVSYTYAEIDDAGNATLNGMTTDASGAGLINVFDYDRLSQFYTEIEGEILALESGGAELTVVFLHWGEEYSTVVSEAQKEMAQKLCDLGVDVIIGTHPHVVQPLELLAGTENTGHRTICLYSAGTLLSNLRADTIGMPTSHCEDGVVLNLTLGKYNDGSVRVTGIGLLPTWVQVDGSDENRDFYILPLDAASDWREAYGLSDDEFSLAKASYNRTMELLTPGLNKISNYLTEQNAGLNPDLGVG